MHAKFKESVTNRDGSVQNYYMRSTPLEALVEKYKSGGGCYPKLRQKIMNELVRRGKAHLV